MEFRVTAENGFPKYYSTIVDSRYLLLLFLHILTWLGAFEGSVRVGECGLVKVWRES